MALCPYEDEGPKSDPNAPETEPACMTADQQIRAKALECAIAYGPGWDADVEFGKIRDEFERYIREGK